MKEELNLLESQFLRIYRNNHKKADQSLEYNQVLEQGLKALRDGFDSLANSLIDKGYISKKGNDLVLTDKGDQYLYHKKLYSDY
jgi:TPP-dependent pyruvate/acetoin dehydrogenase alpha subunit